MKNLRFLLAVVFLMSISACNSRAQTYKYVPNDGTTGTTQFKLAKINLSGNAVVMATTDTSHYTGVCVQNCGTTGTATLQTSGAVPLFMSNTATANHYVQISGATGGDGLDTGATTFPSAGGDVIGTVQIGAAAAATSLIDLFPAEIPAAVTTIATGTATLGTSAIASAACATVVTVSAPGVLTTDVIRATFNGDPTGVTGYAASASGNLRIYPYPTANNVNFKVCNSNSASITPGAITLNFQVVR